MNAKFLKIFTLSFLTIASLQSDIFGSARRTSQSWIPKWTASWVPAGWTAQPYQNQQLPTQQYQTFYQNSYATQAPEQTFGSLSWANRQQEEQNWQESARRARQEQEEQNEEKIHNLRMIRFFRFITALELIYLSPSIIPAAIKKSFEYHVISNSKKPRTISYKIDKLLKEKNYPALQELINAELDALLANAQEFAMIWNIEQNRLAALQLTPELAQSLLNALYVTFAAQALCDANNNQVGQTYVTYFVNLWLINTQKVAGQKIYLDSSMRNINDSMKSQIPNIFSFYLNLHKFDSNQHKQEEIGRWIDEWVTKELFKGSKADKEMLNMLINTGKQIPTLNLADPLYETKVQALRNKINALLDPEQDQRLMWKIEQYFKISQPEISTEQKQA